MMTIMMMMVIIRMMVRIEINFLIGTRAIKNAGVKNHQDIEIGVFLRMKNKR